MSEQALSSYNCTLPHPTTRYNVHEVRLRDKYRDGFSTNIDRYLFSPNNVDSLLSRQVMRKQKIIN